MCVCVCVFVCVAARGGAAALPAAAALPLSPGAHLPMRGVRAVLMFSSSVSEGRYTWLVPAAMVAAISRAASPYRRMVAGWGLLRGGVTRRTFSLTHTCMHHWCLCVLV